MGEREKYVLYSQNHSTPLLSAVCHTLHMCKTNATDNRDLYRNEFVPGLLAAFFGHYLQGNDDIVQYITTPAEMPVALGELKVDINC